ncbi:MAG: ABC transporter permease [Acetatifactor sp.]|nr:ABC transporter permease [Acetatifactor sp.]
MLWVGAFTVSETMTDTYTTLFENGRLEDACFTTSRAILTEDISSLEENYDVILEKQTYKTLAMSDTKLRVFSNTEKLNLVQVSVGNSISKDDDALITYQYAVSNGISIGDSLGLFGKTFHVCGYCLKPDYASMYAEFTDTFPDGKNFGIAIISRQAMEELGDSSFFYSVKYLDDTKSAAFRKEVYELYGTMQYVSYNDNPRTGALLASANDLKAEFSVYSPIIMLVVIVVTAMVLSRTVRRESKSIGTLMALGYEKKELVRHYAAYALIPSIVGDILGAIGCVPFAKLFCLYMFEFAEHIEYSLSVPITILIVALLLPPITYCLTALIVINRCMKTDVVKLLRGEGKGKISHALRSGNLRFQWLYQIRSILANKGRSLTLLVGIAAATMAVMVSGLYQHAYDDFLNNKVPKAMLGGQYEYGFTDFQSENPYGDYAIFDISMGVKNSSNLFNLIGYEEGCELMEAETLSGNPMTYGGYYMTSAAANLFGIQKGDSFTFYNQLSMEDTTVTITDIIKNDVLSLVVTSKANVAQILHRGENEYNVIISKEPLSIPDGLLSKNASLENYRSSTENALRIATIVLYIVKILGALICILVVGMLAGMIVEENRRSISLLEVLGYKGNEIRSLILSSNHLLVPFGFLFGIPLGIALSKMIANANAETSGMFMTIELTVKSFVTGMIFVGLAYVISLLLAGRKLKKVDMVECLKEDRE